MPRSSSSPRLDWNPRGFFFRAGLREPSNEKEGAQQSLREWKIKLEDCSWAIDSSLSERSPGSREASNRWPVRDWLFPIPIFFLLFFYSSQGLCFKLSLPKWNFMQNTKSWNSWKWSCTGWCKKQTNEQTKTSNPASSVWVIVPPLRGPRQPHHHHLRACHSSTFKVPPQTFGIRVQILKYPQMFCMHSNIWEATA